MVGAKGRTALLGLAFLVFLVLSYVENSVFFGISSFMVGNEFLSFGMIFLNNIIVVSLILLGMSFYVNLVLLGLFGGERYEYSVLEHPRIFAVIFTVVILFSSILRGVIIYFGGVRLEVLPSIFLVSAPIGLVEGYGVYLTISKTLSRRISMRWLAHIYVVFLIAAAIEVVFMHLLAGGY